MRHCRPAPFRRISALAGALLLLGVVAGCGGSSGSSTSSTAAPTVSAISPSSGTTAGGTAVTITGSNFLSVNSVMFGAVAATSYTVNSTSSITAVAPAGSGTVKVAVATVFGASAGSAADEYTYTGVTTTNSAPVISGITPTGVQAGTAVTITGTGFSGVTAVMFGSTAAAYTVNSSTSITATVPNLGTTGGNTSVTVITSAGTSNAIAWSYSPAGT